MPLSLPNGVKPPKRAHENGCDADQHSPTQLGIVQGGPPVPRHIIGGCSRALYASVLLGGTSRPCASSSTAVGGAGDAISLCSVDSDDTDDMGIASYFAVRKLEDGLKKQRCDRERLFEQKRRDREIAQKERDASFNKIISALCSDPHTDPVVVASRAAAERQTVELLAPSNDDSDGQLFNAPFPPTSLSQVATCGKKGSDDDGSIRTYAGSIRTQSPTVGAFDLVSSPTATSNSATIATRSMVTPISSSVSSLVSPIMARFTSIQDAVSSVVEAAPPDVVEAASPAAVTAAPPAVVAAIPPDVVAAAPPATVEAAPPAAVAAPSIVAPLVSLFEFLYYVFFY